MLRIVNIEEIQRMLNSVSGLVDVQQRHDSTFDEKVKMWLTKLEKILESNRIMFAGEIASQRATILAAENGILPPGMEMYSGIGKRKIVQATATLSLRNASRMVTDYLRKEVDRVADAERMMRQIIAMAKAKGLITAMPIGNNRTEALKSIWRNLAADAELVPGTINVEGLVGPHDALIILDRIMASDL